MKSTAFILLFLVAFLSFSVADQNRPLANEDYLACGSPILSGCIGTCGAPYSGTAVAKIAGLYCFDAVSSLCANTGAKTVLRKNGAIVFSGDTSGGLSFFFPASPGDLIEVSAELVSKKSKVICVWLGNLDLAIRQP